MYDAGAQVYLLHAAPPPARDAGLHPPGQRQQLVVSLPPLRLLRVLFPLLLRAVRVRLVLPLQPAPLPRLDHPLRVTSVVIFLIVVVIVVLFILVAAARRRRAVVASQEGALPAGDRAAVVAGGPPGLAPVPVLLLAVVLRRALEVGL